MDTIYLWFSEMYNDLLHASLHYPEDKLEEQITFVFLAESDDEWDDKSDAAKTFNISCGGGGYRSSLKSINVSVSAASDVVCCWILLSALFLPNDPISSDDMVDWDNDLMLVIGGGDTNIHEGSFVLHNSW